MNIVVTGGTGMIGRPIVATLASAGHEVTVLTRDTAKAKAELGSNAICIKWGEGANETWAAAAERADAVIHLAGASVGEGPWTPEMKQTIRMSRIATTRAIVSAMVGGAKKPRTLVSASAVGFYGNSGDATLKEEAQAYPGRDFLAGVCAEWEAEAREAEQKGVRVTRLRLGVVLGEDGALKRILYPLPVRISPFKLGMGGRLGSGRQWMSWIHVDDAAALFVWAATTPSVSGVFNATAPFPVTNAEFTKTLARVLGRPAFIPAPPTLLRLMVGDFADVLLGGQKALPTAVQKLGFVFKYPELEPALRSILSK